MFRSVRSAASPSRSPVFGRFALAAAILGLISVPVVPIIFVVGTISIIGIPIALAVLVFPTICMAVVIAYLVWRVFLFRYPMGVPFSFLGALAVMVLVPLVHNLMVTLDVRSLRADDLAGQVAPLRTDETLVVFKPQRVTDRCDDVCVELLLSGHVKAYAASRMPRGQTLPGPDAKVLIHQLVRAASCGKRQIYLRGEGYKKTQAGTAAYALAAAEVQGMCIQSVESTLDQVVSPRLVAFLSHKHLDHLKSALFIDTLIRPSRATIYERTDANSFAPVIQDTRVSYSLLRPLLAYHLSMGQISSVKPKWWRKQVSVSRPEVRDYLHSFLGVRLRYK